MKNATIGLILCIFMLGNLSHADTVHLGTMDVLKTMIVQDSSFGGCMVRLDVNPTEHGADCPTNGWVSLSCNGAFMDRERAWRMLDSAQMAMALGRQVQAFVNDHQKHNGYCVLDRIDVD